MENVSKLIGNSHQLDSSTPDSKCKWIILIIKCTNCHKFLAFDGKNHENRKIRDKINGKRSGISENEENCTVPVFCGMSAPYISENTLEGGQKGRPNIYMERYREFGAVFRTFSLSLADEQIFPPRKTQNISFQAVLLYIIPFQRTFGGVKLFKLRIDFRNLIV